MELGEYITKYRKEAGITIDELASRSGVPKGTINKIIAGTTKSPTLENVWSIATALNKSLDDFMETPKKAKNSSSDLSEEELEVARDYKDLDHHGKTAVRVIVDVEKKRVGAEKTKKREKSLWEDAGDEFGGSSTGRVIPLYFTPAAAGYVSPVFGEDFEYIEVGGEVPRQADFAINISGDSMEPYIMDGATVYVNRDPIAEGDVGIFCLDGDMLCKQYHRDEEGNVYLLSLNREREDADRVIPADSGMSLTCFGRVMMPR